MLSKCQLHPSPQVSKLLSKPSSSIQLNLPRNFQKNSQVLSRSQLRQDHIHLPSVFWTPFMVFTLSFTFLCQSQQPLTKFLIELSLLLHLLKFKANLSTKLLKSLIPKLIEDAHANYSTLYIGQVMRTLTKNFPGSQLQNLSMQKNSPLTFTQHIWTNLALYHICSYNILLFISFTQQLNFLKRTVNFIYKQKSLQETKNYHNYFTQLILASQATFYYCLGLATPPNPLYLTQYSSHLLLHFHATHIPNFFFFFFLL